jgi:hypothetical protein
VLTYVSFVEADDEAGAGFLFGCHCCVWRWMLSMSLVVVRIIQIARGGKIKKFEVEIWELTLVRHVEFICG